MKLRHISWNNLIRRKSRMVFLVLGLMIGITTAVTLITISETMSADISQKLDEYGANILIVPQSDDLSLSYGGMTVSGLSYDARELNQDDTEKIRTIKNKESISIVAPKVIGTIKLEHRTLLLVGVDFKEELRLKKWWRILGERPKEKNNVLIGMEVKRKLNLNSGETIEIISDATGKREILYIRGILEETGSQDDHLIFADLKMTQRLLGKGNKLSLIEVAALCNTCPIEEIVSQTSNVIPNAKVTAIKQSIQSKMETVHRFHQFSIGISIVVLFIGSLIVFTNIMASVNERTREIGIFRAIGFRQSHIMKIIFMEVLITSLTAGVIGYFAGFGISRFLVPRVTGTKDLVLSMSFELLGISVLLAVVTGILAGIYPALKASRLDPTIALRAL